MKRTVRSGSNSPLAAPSRSAATALAKSSHNACDLCHSPRQRPLSRHQGAFIHPRPLLQILSYIRRRHTRSNPVPIASRTAALIRARGFLP